MLSGHIAFSGCKSHGEVMCAMQCVLGRFLEGDTSGTLIGHHDGVITFPAVGESDLQELKNGNINPETLRAKGYADFTTYAEDKIKEWFGMYGYCGGVNYRYPPW